MSVKQAYARSRRRLILLMNRARFFVKLRRRGWFVELMIHERFRPHIHLIGYGLTAFSLLSAFIVFGSAWQAFVVGIVVFLVTKIVEKAAFIYSSMFITPMPSFSLKPEKWLGAVFGFSRQPGNPYDIPSVGMLVQDEDYARKIHGLLLAWSCGELKDEAKNVCVSVVMLRTSYFMFLYPSFSREPARRFFQAVEGDRGAATPDERHHELFVLLVLGKRFTMEQGSALPTFRRRYTADVPYLFHVMIPGQDGQPTDVPGLQPLILFSLRIVEKDRLNRQDVEYFNLMDVADE